LKCRLSASAEALFADLELTLARNGSAFLFRTRFFLGAGLAQTPMQERMFAAMRIVEARLEPMAFGSSCRPPVMSKVSSNSNQFAAPAEASSATYI
jgi:hypothetical protein